MDVHQLIEFETGLADSSPFYFGAGIANRFPEYLQRHEFDRCFLITSPRVLELFGNDILRILDQRRIRCVPIVINDAEPAKDWDTLRALCEELTARGVTKDSILLALGGGVIGNVVGLAAALIYRGIRFIEMPTTITAQTDSTLSNKQAINGAQGKNQFGVYHAPLFVWADADYPRSEPPRQQASGIVEAVKNVFITQDDVAPAEEIVRMWRSGRAFPELLLALIRSKLPIIHRDPSEKASAITLEYGHTFGHAIEWLAKGRLLHGEAVSIGMCLAADLGLAMGCTPAPFRHDHYRILGDLLGAPTRIPPGIATAESIYQTMLADNKRTRKGLRFLLLERCGQFVNPAGDYLVAADRDRVLSVMEQSMNNVEKRAS
jgi:3-dehydroquinate synthetase